MKAERFKLIEKAALHTKKGFVLVEALLAIAVLTVFIGTFIRAYVYGEESSLFAAARVRAGQLAEEGLEAARNIRNGNFTNLTVGNHGIVISANKWAFSGTSDTTGIFQRVINVSTVDADRKLVTSTITWQQNPQRTGTVTLSTYLTNWR